MYLNQIFRKACLSKWDGICGTHVAPLNAIVTGKAFFHGNHQLCRKRVVQGPEDVEQMPIYQFATDKQKRHKRVYVWGRASCGALGNPTLIKPKVKGLRPRTVMHHPIRLRFGDNQNITDIACGYGFTLFAVKSDDQNKVFGTGINADSQLGFHQPRRGHPLEFLLAPVPIPIPFMHPAETVVSKIACGRAHTIVVTDKEGVFCLGNNTFGQCGRPIIENEKYSGNPTIHKVRGLGDKIITKVVCGHDHTLFLTDRGEVLACGLNTDGQLGAGHYKCEWKPSIVEGDIVGEKIVELSSFGDFTLAVSDKGDVFAWGNNEYKQFGNVFEEQQIAYSIHLPLGIGKVVKVATASTMCGAVNDKGEVHVWGYGILGFGPAVEMQKTPRKIPETLFGNYEGNEDVVVKDLKCGLSRFAAVTNKGDLYMWGENIRSCLGLSVHKLDQFFPLRVSMPAEVLNIHLGVDHSVASCISFI